MASCLRALLALLVLQIYVSAAPSNTTQVEEPKVLSDEEPKPDSQIPNENEQFKKESPRLDSQPLPIKDSQIEDNSTQSTRQKRFYNFYGYGAPPISPVVYPSYNKRQSADTGVYGLVDDPLEHIQKRLQDIASFVRQPVLPPPPPTHFPYFFPVLYIPQYSCECNSENPKPQMPENQQPQNPAPVPQNPKPEQNETTPDIVNRVPPMEDEQNWGIMTNESDPEYDEDEFRRPISFSPSETNVPTMRPAPPVDHGSSQDGSGSGMPNKMTTLKPPEPPRLQGSSNSQKRPPTTRRPDVQDSPPYPGSFAPTNPRNEQPNTCDGAVLSCCHQPQVTYDCFVLQGCPDPTSYGNPCDPVVILQVIEKFQKFYGVRNGK